MKSKSHRRKFLGTSATVGAIGLVGCLGEDNDETTDSGDTAGEGYDELEIEIASSYEPGHIIVEASEMFADRIEEETDGSVTAQVVPGGAYGSSEDIAELLNEGTVEMAGSGTPPFEMYAPEYYIFNNPFTLQDHDHMVRIMESDVMMEGRETLRENGNQRILAEEHPWFYRGARHFTSNEPVETPEDLEGMGLRLPQFDSWISIWEEVGVTAVPVALDELYTALQTGTADASEGPAPQVHTSSLYEVQDYYSLTNHHLTGSAIYASNDWFESLEPSLQDLMTEIADEVHREATEIAENEEEELIDELEDEGMNIVRDVDTDAFFDAGEPAAIDVYEDEYPITYDELQDI